MLSVMRIYQWFTPLVARVLVHTSSLFHLFTEICIGLLIPDVSFWLFLNACLLIGTISTLHEQGAANRFLWSATTDATKHMINNMPRSLLVSQDRGVGGL